MRGFHLLSAALPGIERVTLDWRIVLYSLVCAFAVTLLCGLVPALRGTRSGFSQQLAQGNRSVSVRSPLQWALVAVQVALAVNLFVSPGYFDTMRIAHLQGESCKPGATVLTVLVNRSFANTYFAGASPISHHLAVASANNFVRDAEVRGIVADAREQGLNTAPGPTVYHCLSAPNPAPNFLVRTHADPAALATTIQRKVLEIDPARSVYDIIPLDQHLNAASADN